MSVIMSHRRIRRNEMPCARALDELDEHEHDDGRQHYKLLLTQ